MWKKNLFFKVLTASLVATLVIGLSAIVYGSITSSDPLVTFCYFNNTYLSKIFTEVNNAFS